MSVTELIVDAQECAAAAGTLRAARRDTDPGAAFVVILRAGDDPGEPATDLLVAAERVPGPIVVAVSGSLGAAGLALCCLAAAAVAHPETSLLPVDPEAALGLGLAGRLTERVGPAHASGFVLGTAEAAALFASGLIRSAADPGADARALAARLGDETARALRRSLAFAARSPRRDSEEYDRELLALLREHVQ
jgi:enoyl-CoA hydratase/carnithine racemase